MVRYDPSSRSDDDQVSVADPIATDSTQQHADMLETQLDRSRRLNEYYNQVVAELRASLIEIGEEDIVKTTAATRQ